MAKKTDHLGGLEAEETGGFFSALLADEDGFDYRRTLWRVAAWGVVSVASVAIAVAANQSSIGWQRDQGMTADLVQQANRLQAVARESQNEARRLASAVETLNSDRDRLYARVTTLEQGLDSVTGAIAKQNAAAAAPATPVPAEAQPAAQPSPATPPTPAVAPVATKPAAPAEKASAAASAEPPPSSTAAVREVPTKPSAMPATPLVESKSMMAPPDPAAGKLEPSKAAGNITAEPLPAIVAASPFNENTGEETADAALPKVQRTEFGVDVGGANTVAGLRTLWRGLLKSRSTASLAGLQPIIAIREGNGGRSMQLRLVAGPLGDAAAAAKLCAAIAENDRGCETAVYEGQRLTLKAEDAAASEKPAAPAAARKKNGSQKRAASEETKRLDPQPKWAGFFGKRN